MVVIVSIIIIGFWKIRDFKIFIFININLDIMDRILVWEFLKEIWFFICYRIFRGFIWVVNKVSNNIINMFFFYLLFNF